MAFSGAGTDQFLAVLTNESVSVREKKYPILRILLGYPYVIKALYALVCLFLLTVSVLTALSITNDVDHYDACKHLHEAYVAAPAAHRARLSIAFAKNTKNNVGSGVAMTVDHPLTKAADYFLASLHPSSIGFTMGLAAKGVIVLCALGAFVGLSFTSRSHVAFHSKPSRKRASLSVGRSTVIAFLNGIVYATMVALVARLTFDTFTHSSLTHHESKAAIRGLFLEGGFELRDSYYSLFRASLFGHLDHIFLSVVMASGILALAPFKYLAQHIQTLAYLIGHSLVATSAVRAAVTGPTVPDKSTSNTAGMKKEKRGLKK